MSFREDNEQFDRMMEVCEKHDDATKVHLLHIFITTPEELPELLDKLESERDDKEG